MPDTTLDTSGSITLPDGRVMDDTTIQPVSVEEGELAWDATATAVVEAIKARLAPKLRLAVDDLYYGLLDTTQDYLLDNVIYNVRQSIASANRQALHDRCRLDEVERENSRLRIALHHISSGNGEAVECARAALAKDTGPGKAGG